MYSVVVHCMNAHTKTHAHSLTLCITPYPFFPDRNHRGSTCDGKDFNNPDCHLGRLIGWPGAKQVRRKLSLSLDYKTYYKWFLGMPNTTAYCGSIAFRHWQIPTSLIKNIHFFSVKRYRRKVTTLNWCNDVWPHQRSVTDNSVTDNRAALYCGDTVGLCWSTAVIFNKHWVMAK